MTAYEKPEIDLPAVQQLLEDYYGHKVDEVKPLDGGNLSTVYSFNEDGRGFVIRFSDIEGAYGTEGYISRVTFGKAGRTCSIPHFWRKMCSMSVMPGCWTSPNTMRRTAISYMGIATHGTFFRTVGE